jgi:hypothetical protein
MVMAMTLVTHRWESFFKNKENPLGQITSKERINEVNQSPILAASPRAT